MNILGLCFLLVLNCKGLFGVSLDSVKTCSVNSDCPSSRTCIEGFCKSPCLTECGPDALCVVMKHKPYCFCKDDTKDCLPNKASRKCEPECEKNSICNTQIGYCQCKSGFIGNPYKGCSKKCRSFSDCETDETCNDGICKNPCDKDCGINSLCVVSDHSTLCNCPPGYIGNAFEICRPIGIAKRLRATEICKQCGENAVCQTLAGSTTCICPRGFVGNPFVTCNKMCLSNEDCSTDKICLHHECNDPCEDACGVNTMCEVDILRRKPVCTCLDGFTGDPTRICTMSLNVRFAESDEEIQCHPRCGANATCNTNHGICTCNAGFIGNPYGDCRKKCSSDSNCDDDRACFDGDCKSPCLTGCGKNALCSVKKHKATCRCPYGYSGDASQICEKTVVTQPSIIEVDLCDTINCGTNAYCKLDGDEKCSCLHGYIGNPYKECLKKCSSSQECADKDWCSKGICKNACENSCGINAQCNATNHMPTCSCPSRHKGDPLKICFPNISGVLVNPSRVPCLKCICRAITGNDDIFDCAEKSISFRYWAFAGEDLVGGEDFRTRNSTLDFITCMHNRICILNTMNDYISRVMHRLNDIDCDGQVTCADYFAAHKFGLTAKFPDSIFKSSEARSFDQCENHGTRDIDENWTPRTCNETSLIEILS